MLCMRRLCRSTDVESFKDSRRKAQSSGRSIVAVGSADRIGAIGFQVQGVVGGERTRRTDLGRQIWGRYPTVVGSAGSCTEVKPS
jgi:hypothetical protein